MKPNFALDLTHDGIGLMHRGKGGWVLVGEVSLTDADLLNSLSMMRQRAGDLDKGGFTSKLIIPPSQILFTSMTAPGPDDITREARIREGLEGLTPYPVEELVFDWYADGDMTHVAIVARETLDEAEGFAEENRMNPVCFTARPHGSFTREVSFGETNCAEQFLRQGANQRAKVEREHRAPPELMGTEVIALPDKAIEPAPPGAQSSDISGTQPEKQPQAAAPQAPLGTEDTSNARPASAPPALAPFPPDFEPDEDAPSRSTSKTLIETSKAAASVKEGTPSSKSAPAQKPAPKAAPTDPAKADPAASVTRPSSPPPKRPGTPTEPEETAPKSAEKPAKPSGSENGADANSMPAFSTRRAGHEAASDSADAGPKTADITSRINVVSSLAPKTPEATSSPEMPPAPPVRVQTEVHVPVTAPTVDGEDLAPKPKKRAKASKAKAGANGAARKLKDVARKGLAGASGASSIASSLAKATSKSLANRTPKANGAALDTAIAPPPPSARSAEQNKPAKASSKAQERARTEADALTIFGARKSQDIGGKPKYLGLFLVLGLLLLMAVLAVWSMFFLSEQDVNLFPDPEDQFESAITTGTPLDEANQVARAPVLAPDEDIVANEQLGADGQPLTDAALVEADEGQHNETLSPEAAEIRYAATGIWERAPDPLEDPSGDRIDELYVASIDPVTAGHDAVALPQARLEHAASLPASRLPPPPQGTRFDLDERGLVRATPEGSLTPEGVTVYAGRPALVPAPRPEGIASEAEVETAEVLPAVPSLPRPRLRPEGLIESNERRVLGGRTRNELAALRPAPRPESPQAVAQAAAIAEAIANAEDAANQASLAAAAIAPTKLAVARSPEPKSRPRNFDKLVAAARASTDASDGSVAVAAAPRNQTVTPSIPTRASIAKQATIKNAIPLRKVALIGIYGSASKRRALVRLKSGRYVKVGIGDRLDGGRVMSITTNQLIYKKGSRSTTLKILPFG